MSHVAKGKIKAIWRQAGSIKVMTTALVSCIAHTSSDSDDERGINA